MREMVCPKFDENALIERALRPVALYTNFGFVIESPWHVSAQGDHHLVEAFEVRRHVCDTGEDRRFTFLCACGCGFDDKTAKVIAS